MLKTEMSMNSSIPNMKVNRTAEIKRLPGGGGRAERTYRGAFDTNLAIL